MKHDERMNDLANRLDRAITERGITRNELAKERKSNVDDTAIPRYLNGK